MPFGVPIGFARRAKSFRRTGYRKLLTCNFVRSAMVLYILPRRRLLPFPARGAAAPRGFVSPTSLHLPNSTSSSGSTCPQPLYYAAQSPLVPTYHMGLGLRRRRERPTTLRASKYELKPTPDSYTCSGGHRRRIVYHDGAGAEGASAPSCSPTALRELCAFLLLGCGVGGGSYHHVMRQPSLHGAFGATWRSCRRRSLTVRRSS